MSTTTTRRIDLTALPFPAVMRGSDGNWEIEADVTQAALEAAVKTAPTYLEPPDRLADIEDALLGDPAALARIRSRRGR